MIFCGRGIDPWQDSESALAECAARTPHLVAEVSIRGRILKVFCRAMKSEK